MSLGSLKVSVAGRDVTSLFSGIVTSVSITLNEEKSSDSADLTLADVGGRVRMPQKDDPVTISFAGAVLFRGKVDEPGSTGDGGSGRVLNVSCKALATRSKAKEKMSQHADDMTFSAAAKKFGQKAGVTDIKVSGSIGSISRKYWSMNGESFIHWGRRIAKEIGAVFQIEDNRARFTKKNEPVSAGGAALGGISARAGVNLLSWDVRPSGGRPRKKKAKGRYFDRKEGKFKEVEVEIDDDSTDAEDNLLADMQDEGATRAAAGSSKADVEEGRGSGSVTILGNAAARPGATLTISGARPGVDGSYKIKTVTHSFAPGFTTQLSIAKPEGSAGVDGR